MNITFQLPSKTWLHNRGPTTLQQQSCHKTERQVHPQADHWHAWSPSLPPPQRSTPASKWDRAGANSHFPQLRATHLISEEPNSRKFQNKETHSNYRTNIRLGRATWPAPRPLNQSAPSRTHSHWVHTSRPAISLAEAESYDDLCIPTPGAVNPVDANFHPSTVNLKNPLRSDENLNPSQLEVKLLQHKGTFQNFAARDFSCVPVPVVHVVIKITSMNNLYFQRHTRPPTLKTS